MSPRNDVSPPDRVAAALRRLSMQRYIRRAELTEVAITLACRTGSHDPCRTAGAALNRLGFPGNDFPALTGIVRGAPLATHRSPLFDHLLAAEKFLERPKFVKRHGSKALADATVEIVIATFILKGVRQHGR